MKFFSFIIRHNITKNDCGVYISTYFIINSVFINYKKKLQFNIKFPPKPTTKEICFNNLAISYKLGTLLFEFYR